jgi:hypothetical protein
VQPRPLIFLIVLVAMAATEARAAVTRDGVGAFEIHHGRRDRRRPAPLRLPFVASRDSPRLSAYAAVGMTRARAERSGPYPSRLPVGWPTDVNWNPLMQRPTDSRKLPRPTERFRRRAWLAFERALDPLGTPRRLPNRPRGRHRSACSP